ncbi:MAG: 16S rRNA (adenine(1518)-N(6)/adenine(1519)-N(6))-dimethyltransferase RsmA [Planctomycetota bacterium]
MSSDRISLKQRVLADLAAADCAPLHRFGQNFMIDQHVLDALISALGPLRGRRVIEIGPGTGVLTARLIDEGAQVLAIEIDRGLTDHLTTTLVPRGLTLVHGDALAAKGRLHDDIVAWAAAGDWSLASNLPYDVAIPVVTECAALPRQPQNMVATVQFECGRRLCSRPGDDAWGASAAVLQAAGEPRIVRRVNCASFHPRPRVDSAIVAWTPRQPLPAGFALWVRGLFAYRRKVLPRALMDLAESLPTAASAAASTSQARDAVTTACAAAGIDAARRVENLDAPELLNLYAHVRALAN